MSDPTTHDIPQQLYDHEINFSISAFWDGGFMVKIGDELNGFRAETTVATYAEALQWLEQQTGGAVTPPVG
jgi:squalene cyclase